MAEPTAARRRARRSDGGRAFQEVLSHARSLLELTDSTQKELRSLRSVREAGALLDAAATASAGSAAALARNSGLDEHWRARALSTSNLQRLHSVVAELSEAIGRAVPPSPPPRLAAGEGGESSDDEDAEAWALAPPWAEACAKRHRAGDPCSDKPLREVRQQQQAPAARQKRQRVEDAAAAEQLDTENDGNDAPLPPPAASAASSSKSPVDPSKLSVSVLQDRLRGMLGQQAKLPRKKDELVRLYQQQRQQQRRGRPEESVDLTSDGDEGPAEPSPPLRSAEPPARPRAFCPCPHEDLARSNAAARAAKATSLAAAKATSKAPTKQPPPQQLPQPPQQQAPAAPPPQQCSAASPSRALPAVQPPFLRLRLRQTRGPPLLSPVFSLAHCPARVSIGRQHLSLELISGPAAQRPDLAAGFDGMLRYGGGHEVRIGRAPCTPGPEGNTMQLRGSPKVSRRACSIVWDEASSRFRVTSLGSVGMTVDGAHCKADTHTPVGERSTIAFFGNPDWPVGHRPVGAIPTDAYVFELRSTSPQSSDGSRWELGSPIVSREHCALEYDARSGCWSVADSGSTFGTTVGGRKLTRGKAAPLRPGSELLLGSSLADSRALGFVLEPDC